MKVYMYRLISDTKKSELGLAVAENQTELFWILDEFGDPFQYQFSIAEAGDALSIAVEFCGDDPGIGCNNKYHVAKAIPSDEDMIGYSMSETVGDQTRAWKRFVQCSNGNFVIESVK